jgi:peptidoglycan-associated lipoprotein
MKAIKFSSLLVAVLALLVAATGCQKKPVGVTPISGRGYKVGEGGMQPIEGGTLGGQGVTGENIGGGPQNPDLSGDLSNFNQDRATLAANIVHFDYDSSVVKSSEKGNVEAVAAYMKGNAGVSLLIEGHCDERGTEEYNRSLGERRALALREALVADGVDGMKVTTRSFGEDKPAVSGHDEAAWSQNRRGEFIVLHPK